jgi:chromosome segregation ATPase
MIADVPLQTAIAAMVAIAGTGGLGAWVGVWSTRRKTMAETAKIKAEVAHLEEERFSQRVQTLGRIIDELSGSVDRYQDSLSRLEKRYDELLKEGAANAAELVRARQDLLDHKDTIKTLRSRITDLENLLTDKGIPIPPVA